MELIPATVVASVLNNKMCAWLTNYLNHVQMTHVIYSLGNPTDYLFIIFHMSRNIDSRGCEAPGIGVFEISHLSLRPANLWLQSISQFSAFYQVCTWQVQTQNIVQKDPVIALKGN